MIHVIRVVLCLSTLGRDWAYYEAWFGELAACLVCATGILLIAFQHYLYWQYSQGEHSFQVTALVLSFTTQSVLI